MCATPSRPPRVLLGDLAPMHRLGMRRMLAERGVEVREESRAAELERRLAALTDWPKSLCLSPRSSAASRVKRSRIWE